MRSLALRSFPVFVSLLALSTLLTGCPEKGAPADKTGAEAEHPEPDDQGKLDANGKKPAAAAPAEEKKAEEREEGGW